MADRGYGHREGVAGVLAGGGHVVVRIGVSSFPLETLEGAFVALPTCLEGLRVGEVGDWRVQFRARGRTWPIRLVALRKTQLAAEAEQLRLPHEAGRKKRRPDPRSLQAAHFVMVVTNLSADEVSATQVMELCRLRR